MDGTMEFDAAIIGAGIAGSSLAKALADRGWHVLLLDKRSFPRHKVCGEFLSPESIGILAALGLEEPIRELRPAVIRASRLEAHGGASIRVPLPGIAWGLSRYALDSALHDEARRAGAEVATGTAVSAIRRDGADGFTLEIKLDGRSTSVSARAAIGAWGGNGRVPGIDGTARPKRGVVPHLGVKAHYAGIEPADEVELFFFQGGYLGLSPAGGGIVNAAALLDRRAVPTAPPNVQGWLDIARARSPALDRRLAGARPIPDSHAAVAPVRLYGRPVAWDGIPLVGDACATIPPLCGDGMSMALRAAQLCAVFTDGRLRGELSASEWEASYTRAIRREFSGPLRWGSLLQRASAHPAICRLAMTAAARMPVLASRLVGATRLPGRSSPNE